MQLHFEPGGMPLRDHAGSGSDLGHLELNDTNEFSAVLSGLLSQYGMSLESEQSHQQMSTGMHSGDPPYGSQGANPESPYSSVLPRNVNQLDPSYSPLQRGSSGLNESQYNAIQRGGSGNGNEPSYASVPRRASTASSPYSMAPRGASNSPYSDLSRASGSHDSPYTVSQEDGSPYSSRCSSAVGANSDAHLAVPNGVSIPNGHYSTVSGNRSVPQNDPYNFQLASNGPYMKLTNSGTYPGRQDSYAGSYHGVCKDVSNRGGYDVMYPDSHGGSDNPYTDTRSDPQYSSVESGASYSSIPSGGPGPCGSPYARVSVENKSNDTSYTNVICGGDSVPYSQDGSRYSSSGSHDGSYGPGATGSHEGSYVTSSRSSPFSNSKSHAPSHSDSRNSFNHNPSVNILYNPNSGHYGGTGVPNRACTNGAYSSAYSSRNVNMNQVNSHEFEGATVNNVMEVVANRSFNSGSQTEETFHQSGSFVAAQSKHHGFESVNCTAFQNNTCNVSGCAPSVEQVFQGKDCAGTGHAIAEHSFQAKECSEEGPHMLKQSGADRYAGEECPKGLLVHRNEVINPPAPTQTHSDDEIEDDFNWDRLL
ncbi:hypothetical protein B7P43_G14224 [Cryptotermes secundus]|uniref:Uncharacterized protein n=2 Tax=Cryptotermes secundus TaxID=105785 RepID=A0A2J7PBL5_9NEOP|nr:hypothetical protein B7P43_G14224 [Cryptotermes secundus]